MMQLSKAASYERHLLCSRRLNHAVKVPRDLTAADIFPASLRWWRQSTTGAIFMAASVEMGAQANHMVVDNG